MDYIVSRRAAEGASQSARKGHIYYLLPDHFAFAVQAERVIQRFGTHREHTGKNVTSPRVLNGLRRDREATTGQ